MFSSTFKVKENKVPIFLWSDANLVSYGYFVVLHRCRTSEENKVSLFLWSDANLVSYGYFVDLYGCRTSDYKTQKLKRSRSPLYNIWWKHKCTLFSSTFKVEENKVPLFLWSGANVVSYGYFVVLHICQTSDHKSQRTKRSISPLYNV